MYPEFHNILGLPYLFSLLNSQNTTTLRNTMIDQVHGTGISTEQLKKTCLINWYFANDPMGSIYLATRRNPALVASYHPDSNRDDCNRDHGLLYGSNFTNTMENYFIKIKTIFGQSMLDQRENVMTKCSSGAIHCVDRLISKRVARDLNLDNQITTNEYVIETPEEVNYLFSSYQLERGVKRYELANHLGNVLTVISDKKTAICTGNTFNYFTAERISATDYSPFGAPLPNRSYTAPNSDYRYGYQSSEKDNEVNGKGNLYTTFFKELDPRLARWLSIDPEAKVKPWESPYVSMGNTPIWHNDQLGNTDDKPRVNNKKAEIKEHNKKIATDIRNTPKTPKTPSTPNTPKKDNTVTSYGNGLEFSLNVGVIAGGQAKFAGNGASLGVGTPILGFKDNEFFLAGNNLNSGKFEKTEIGGFSFEGAGTTEIEKTYTLDKSTKTWNQTKLQVTKDFAIISFSFTTTANEQVSKLSIKFDGVIGFGLKAEGKLQWDLFTETKKLY